MVSLAGRRVLITGAASGIGQAMACRFAEAGAALILVDRDRHRLEQVARLISTQDSPTPAAGAATTLVPAPTAPGPSPAITTYVLDLAATNEITRFWQSLPDEQLPDTLINNAGIYPMRDFLQTDEALLRRTLSVNLEAVLWMCQKFVARRLNRGGVIINVSSIEAVLPFKSDMIPYTVSKAGVIALTRGLARDYGRRGFRVNAILPGAIRTPGTKALVRLALRKLKVDLWRTGYHFQNRLALGRWGDPDEVARVALFLASDLASYVQGALIPVDGGFLSS
ncbi:MAG TPA: SDR family oxidoreductase [Firmicutes bacterium]|nr:SDR family oxidoreductase [Bacillota bacterium]